MKIQPRQAESFLKSSPQEVAAFLLYGPEEGVIRDRSGILIARLLGPGADPLNRVELTGDLLDEDPARLSDEMNAFSFLGGMRVIVLRNPSEKNADSLSNILAALPPQPSSYLVVEAGDLKPTSKIRKLFEAENRAAAIGCYADEGSDLGAMITQTLRERGHSVDREALDYLQQNLSGNRLMNRHTLEKLSTYVGKGSPVTLSHVEACIGDQTESMIYEISQSVAEGNLQETDRLITALFREGSSPISILIVVSRHFQKLLALRADVDQGRTPAQVVESIKPPVFFKQKPRLISQLQRWTFPALKDGMDVLLKADRQCKTTGLPQEALCRAALFRLCQIPRRPRKVG